MAKKTSSLFCYIALRKHAYAITLTAIFHGCKNDHFQVKNCNIFSYFAQDIGCGYSLETPHLGGSNEYPQPKVCFRAKNKKNEYPCKPQFYSIKVRCKGM